ncbi:MAG: NAD(+) diphosphatase [Spirochaetales bacterium]|nr:NAD(+) diphosphatase [Spirochaetales bacterium]
MIFKPLFEVHDPQEIKETPLFLLFSEKENLIALPQKLSPEKGEELFRDNTLWDSRENRDEPLLLIGRLTLDGEEKPLYCGSCEKDTPLPAAWEWRPFIELFRSMEKELQVPFSRAKQILVWERTHRYCGSCGSETTAHTHEPCRRCPACGELYYPRFSPAIIVLIHRGSQLLLAHNKNFPEGLYSNIAGFVETGESLEEAVRREVREEVSLDVENIRYFDSQQWPMPHSLMLGFIAECPEGEPIPDGEEIVHAAWFDRDNLPELPQTGSIAGRMIETFLEQFSGE